MGLDMYLYKEKKDQTEAIGYWRKDNQIHNWFVRNIQNNIDDCNVYSVSKEKLMKLKDICLTVLNDHSRAEFLLPTRQGFFFGDYEYDEDYFIGIEETINILNEISDDIDSQYYYHSSW